MIDWITDKVDNVGYNTLLRFLIWFRVILLYFEITTGTENSHDPSMKIYLWTERFIVLVFTIEVIYRGLKQKEYVWSTLFWIDILAIFPFWIGFFVPRNWLGLIRSLRVLTVLKWVRYSEYFKLVAYGFYNSWPAMKILGVAMFVTIMFSSIIMYELEPQTFDNDFHNAGWFGVVTASTVGYGDISPQTTTGKAAAVIIIFIPALSIFAAMVGVIGNSLGDVLTQYNSGAKIQHIIGEFLYEN